MTSGFDKMSERLTRNLARFSSRRGFLSKLGVALLAAPAFPLLPVARSARAAEPKSAGPKTDFERNSQTTDDTNCNYWKYCGSDGLLYRSSLNNDIIWCFGNSSATYHCSTAALVGEAK